MLVRLSITILIAVFASAANAAETLTPPPVDPRGAVLCQWSIAISMRAVGEACFKGRDEGNLATLDWAIGQMDDFILRNSTTTRPNLEAQKTKFRQQGIKALKRGANGECQPGQDALIFYPKPDKAMNARIHTWMTNLLAVDRPPVWNPCF